MLRWSMGLAYRIVFECPQSPHAINLDRRCRSVSLSEVRGNGIGREKVFCTNPNCT